MPNSLPSSLLACPSINYRLYQALVTGGSKSALVVNQQAYSYSCLQNYVFASASCLQEQQVARLGVLAHRSIEVYRAILGSILSGTTYVPLNPLFPADKTAFIIKHSQCSHLFIGAESMAYALQVLNEHYTLFELKALRIIVSNEGLEALQALSAKAPANSKGVSDLASETGSDQALGTGLASIFALAQELLDKVLVMGSEFTGEVKDTSAFAGLSVDPQHIMHIFYTSGTTGQPKGVVINYQNYSSYFSTLLGMYDFKGSDVFSHFAEITFDISLQDPLLALVCGATVVCPSKKDLLTPTKFIRNNHLTIVMTVPSLVSYMQKTKELLKECNELVRLTIFTGEALWYQQLLSYHQAYPKSRLVNAYGPTEATVWVSHYEVALAQLQDSRYAHAVVALGKPLRTVKFKVCDEQGKAVPLGTQGELYLGGVQLAQGYYQNELKTKEAFVTVDGELYYRTGDIVVAFNETIAKDSVQGQAGESFVNYQYLGRLGDMVKIHGYRVSVYEIEEQISKLTSFPVKALSAQQLTDGIGTTIIIAALENAPAEEIARLKPLLKQQLSFYMLPKYMVSASSFPLNANGKVDRKALTATLIKQLQDSESIKLQA